MSRDERFTLPPMALRFVGAEMKSDNGWLSSADKEVEHLVNFAGYRPKMRLLDIGCGAGRLAIGLIRRFGTADYLGIDVNNAVIEWCRSGIQQKNHSYRFVHLDIRNDRYNPIGKALPSHFKLPCDTIADVVYLYSVFSHMKPVEVQAYLSAIRQVLAPHGKVFLTAFIEEVARVSKIQRTTLYVVCTAHFMLFGMSGAFLWKCSKTRDFL